MCSVCRITRKNKSTASVPYTSHRASTTRAYRNRSVRESPLIWPHNSTKPQRPAVSSRADLRIQSSLKTSERRAKRQSIRTFLTHVSSALHCIFRLLHLYHSRSVLFFLFPFSLSLSLSLSLSPLNYELHRLIPPSPRCLTLLLMSKPPKRRDWRRISGAPRLSLSWRRMDAEIK